MNLKIFLRLLLVLVVVLGLIAGVVVGGVALSYRILMHGDNNNQLTPDQGYISENITQKIEKQEVLNVLLLGVDKEGYRTDAIIVAQYNLETKEVNMLQIPRDTKIDTPRPDKKINSAYAYGKEEELFRAVRKLLGIDVDKYVLINIKSFRELVDEIGGVEINVPINMNYDDPYQNLHIHLNKGKQVLDGNKAEMFVRFRKNNDGTGYPNGDIGRMEAQKQFINAAISKVLSIKNIFKIPKLVSIVKSNIKTNFDAIEIAGYIDDALKMDKENINIYQLPGSDYYNGISYFVPDKEETQALIENYFTPTKENKSMSIENIGNNIEQQDIQIESEQPETEKQEDENSQSVESYTPSWKNRFIRIEVLNGSNTDGIATNVAEDLEAKGFKVVRIGSFSGVRYHKTKVIDRTKRGFSKEVSKAIGSMDTGEDLDSSSGVDVTVIVGNDYVN